MDKHVIKLTWKEAHPFCFVLCTPKIPLRDPLVLFCLEMENRHNHSKQGYWRLQSYLVGLHEGDLNPVVHQGVSWGKRIYETDELLRLANINAESWADKIGIKAEIDSTALDALATTLKGYQQMVAGRNE
jgi:hypothetical protein